MKGGEGGGQFEKTTRKKPSLIRVSYQAWFVFKMLKMFCKLQACNKYAANGLLDNWIGIGSGKFSSLWRKYS